MAMISKSFPDTRQTLKWKQAEIGSFNFISHLKKKNKNQLIAKIKLAVAKVRFTAVQPQSKSNWRLGSVQRWQIWIIKEDRNKSADKELLVILDLVHKQEWLALQNRWSDDQNFDLAMYLNNMNRIIIDLNRKTQLMTCRFFHCFNLIKLATCQH